MSYFLGDVRGTNINKSMKKCVIQITFTSKKV